MMTRMAVVAACLFVVAGVAAAQSPPYYIGEIMPTPKRATYQDVFIPVYDIAGRRPLAAVVFAGVFAGKAQGLAAEAIAARVRELAGLAETDFRPCKGGDSAPEGNLILIGPSPLAAPGARPWWPPVAMRHHGPPLKPWESPYGEEQSYVIQTSRKDDRHICIASGSGTMGDYFAAMSLIQLLTVKDGQVVLRAADVVLKEGKKLILVPRETPLNLIHIKNMELLIHAGATILPANPSFYARPQSIEQVVDTVVARVLDHLGIPNQLTPRWAAEKE